MAISTLRIVPAPQSRAKDYRAVLAVIELSREPPLIHFDTVIRRPGLEVVESARGA